MQSKNVKLQINNLMRNLMKRIDNIKSLIEPQRKEKLVFARLLLPFGSVGEADLHCTHCQSAQAYTQTQARKRANSPTHHYTRMTVLRLIIRTLTD